MRRRGGKPDANQPEIVAKLRDLPGVTVQILSAVGDGCPDLAVGYRGRTFLLEVKDGSKPPSAQALTDDQQVWHLDWRGHVAIVRSFEEAREAIGYLEIREARA